MTWPLRRGSHRQLGTHDTRHQLKLGERWVSNPVSSFTSTLLVKRKEVVSSSHGSCGDRSSSPTRWWGFSETRYPQMSRSRGGKMKGTFDRSIDLSIFFLFLLFVSFSNLPRTFKKRVLFLMRSHSWSESPGAHSNEQRHFRDQRFDAWELVWNRHCSCGRSFGETEVIEGWGPGRGWAEWRWIGREALPWRNGNDRWLPSWHGGLSQSHRQTGKPLVTDWSWCGVSRA